MIGHPVAQREPGRHTPQPKSRLRFSLRALFILTAFVGAVSAWVGTRIHEAHEQADAITALGLPASEVEFAPKHNWQVRIRPILPKRVADWLGEPFFSAVVGLDDFRPSSDAEFCLCLHFPDLESAFIWGYLEDSISAEGLRQLQSLPKLRVLDAGMDALNSGQLEAVAGIKTLESLTVDTADGNTSLRSLAEMRHLQYLSLELDSPNDLASVRLPPTLERLNLCIDRLDGSQFSQAFSRVDVLQELTLSVIDTHLDALTIGTITKLSDLRSLTVTSMDILDAQPSDLAALAKLEKLRVWILNRPVTDLDIARFAAIAPTLNKTMPALKRVEGPIGAVFEFTSQK